MKRNKSFESNKLLYVIATPIGNLKEFTPRAIEVINSLDLLAAEDTRNTKSLLAHFNISKPLISLHEHNETQIANQIIEKINQGCKVGYVSDAGYPLISDPGSILIKKCIDNNIAISTISGSSAFLNALIPSGLLQKEFYFYGFLSSKSSEAKMQLMSLSSFEKPIIFYEAPHRIINTLKLMYEILGDRKATIARELTKINEEIIYGTLYELSNIDAQTLKGEMVIVIEGNQNKTDIDIKEIEEKIAFLKQKNLSNKDIVEIIVKLCNVRKNIVFDLVNKS